MDKSAIFLIQMNLNNSEYDDRKGLLDNLSQLVKSEYEHVFRILKNSGEAYSENCNGIFFDIAAINTITFREIKDYITMCIKIRKSQDDRIDEMNRLKAEVGI